MSHSQPHCCFKSTAQKNWKSTPLDFVQIVYVDPGHWACLCNTSCEEKCVNLYDSAATIPSEEGSIVQKACTVLKSPNLSVVSINVINVKQQVGGTDCGLFAVAIATDLCLSVELFTVSYIQDETRLHLEKCLEDQLMTMQFPLRQLCRC